MGGVQEVRQLDDQRLHWVAEIAGVKREWDATILEQVPDQKVAWAATEGATNAGAVYFQPVGAGRTMVPLHLEYEPQGLVEKAGDKLNIVEKQAESDLEKFKSFIESRGAETGAWRGSVDEGHGVGTPGVEHAASSEGDSGKAGVSGTAVAAGMPPRVPLPPPGSPPTSTARATTRTAATTTETEYVVTDIEVVPDPAATPRTPVARSAGRTARSDVPPAGPGGPTTRSDRRARACAPQPEPYSDSRAGSVVWPATCREAFYALGRWAPHLRDLPQVRVVPPSKCSR